MLKLLAKRWIAGSEICTSRSLSHGKIYTKKKKKLIVIFLYVSSEDETFWFHHQARSVPCMIHVSAPIADIVERYVCIRPLRWGMTCSYGRVSLANLVGS